MVLRFKKGADGGGTTTMLRDDGTSTWQPATPYFVFHDLMHYAVESTLGFTHAFLGLIAGGKDIQDFDKGAKHWLPLEAHWAEIIAGQLQAVTGGSISSNELPASIAAACEGLGVPVPVIPEGALTRIAEVHRQLIARWNGLARGQAMELRWPP
jgi:hypothetical protein